MIGALIGALVGGVCALGGSFMLDLRRDRRRQIAAAMIVAAELRRSGVELEVAADYDESGWREGPHEQISGNRTWLTTAGAELVGALGQADWATLDKIESDLQMASEWGYTSSDAVRLAERALVAAGMLDDVAKPNWTDRNIWRL